MDTIRHPVLPNLGELADPHACHEPLDLKKQEPRLLKKWMEQMYLIRYAEEVIGDKVREGQIKCPCHLAIGQEAVAVAVCHSLRPTDRAFGAHRSHSHYLACGASVEKLFFEVLGKEQGCSKGMGGSMHLYAEEFGLKGTVPIVAGTISLAVGAALAAKMDRKPTLDVGVAYFGDGAAEEGVVHECLNLAMVYNLPVLFVCENNLFSSHLSIEQRQPTNTIARFADAAGMLTAVVDGNDVVETAAASEKLINHCRTGKGPAFLEAVTYRWRGHVGPSEDIDVGVSRKVDLKLWKQRDPIHRLFEAMKRDGLMNDAEFEDLRGVVMKRVQTAWETASTTGSFPPVSSLLGMVYDESSWVGKR